MTKSDEYYVGTCTHVNESDEIDRSAERRIAWLQSMYRKGLRVMIALIGNNQVGFLHLLPIEICPWGPLGRDLAVIPCLVVQERAKGQGVGRALIAAAEEEAIRQNRKGLVTIGYYHDFWFMPARFFQSCAFSPVGQVREVAQEGEKDYLGKEVTLWKVFDSSAHAPECLRRRFNVSRTPGKVTVELFWNTFCQTSNIEAERVRQVAAEFGDSVLLHEYCADDPAVLRRYQIPRAIFIDGDEIGWGYEAPVEGIRCAVAQALEPHRSKRDD